MDEILDGICPICRCTLISCVGHQQDNPMEQPDPSVANAVALLKECLINGGDGPEQLYSWFCGNRGTIEQTVNDLK